jgi:uncharacterized membrane protein
MNDLFVARVLHVLAIVFWIGGVALVTTVLLPVVQRQATREGQLALFEAVERGFATQARIATLVAGASGFYLVERMDLWSRFYQPGYWWMHAMVAVWAIFTLVLFVFEPLYLHRQVIERARRHPDETFRHLVRFHRVMLALSLATVAGAVAGSHGYF